MLTNLEQSPSPKSVFKNPLLYSSIVLGIAILVVGWILYSRWADNRRIEARLAEERAEKQRESDRQALEQFGGKELAIQNFYVSPGVIHPGESARLCYGVANAKTVKIEPETEPVWPSYGHCLNVSPKKDTTYTLAATDAEGKSVTQSVEVQVR
jgi:hypothetical protein